MSTKFSSPPLKSIVVLGGGTAGWMTAASLANRLQGRSTSIIVIDSSEIGTIGVGEATVPAIRDYFASLGLDARHVMRATRATVKLGIEFDGWKASGHKFFHPFGLYGAKAGSVPFHQMWLALDQPGDLADYNLCTQLAYAERFTTPQTPPRGDFDVFDWAVHFDAGLFARYLRDYAVEKGVRHIDAKLAETRLDAETGAVSSLLLQTGESLSADLYVDCSGLRSLLLQRALKTRFIDWKHWLPCDRAIAMPCENTLGYQPYTRATAQSAGWSWRIPLQHRVGNGYVYDSNSLTDEDAEQTLRNLLEGKPLADANTIQFRTGHAASFWVKNVVGIGLSAGFLEPLESTSIALIQSGIEKLLTLLPGTPIAPHLAEEYNRTTKLEFERIRDFIILHYLANQRTKELFWQRCRDMRAPDSLTSRIDLFLSHGHFVRHEWESFFDASWLSVYAGFDWLPPARPEAIAGVDLEYLRAILPRLRSDIRSLAAAAASHVSFIASLTESA